MRRRHVYFVYPIPNEVPTSLEDIIAQLSFARKNRQLFRSMLAKKVESRLFETSRESVREMAEAIERPSFLLPSLTLLTSLRLYLSPPRPRGLTSEKSLETKITESLLRLINVNIERVVERSLISKLYLPIGWTLLLFSLAMATITLIMGSVIIPISMSLSSLLFAWFIKLGKKKLSSLKGMEHEATEEA